MSVKAISTQKAPAPIGPYSQGIQAGNMLFTSGQIAINPESGVLEIDDLKHETHLVMQNLIAVIEGGGFTINNVVKCTIFLASMDDFEIVNSIYGTYFKDIFPARETVEVSKLPKGVNVEISAIAVK